MVDAASAGALRILLNHCNGWGGVGSRTARWALQHKLNGQCALRTRHTLPPNLTLCPGFDLHAHTHEGDHKRERGRPSHREQGRVAWARVGLCALGQRIGQRLQQVSLVFERWQLAPSCISSQLGNAPSCAK